MLCVNSVQRRFQISDYKFFQSDTAPYESRKHSVAEISQQITTGPKCARTDYKHEGEKSEALEMCIRILLGPQKTCRQIAKQEMLSPSMTASPHVYRQALTLTEVTLHGTVSS